MLRCLNPFRSGQCLSTASICVHLIKRNSLNPFRSGQCLSTMDYKALLDPLCVSIPFDQGNVFRPYTAIKMYETCPVSIPFDQGNVFRPCSGLCLLACTVSIPFDQGNVFRQKLNHEEVIRNESQSLSIRAMSFDGYEKASLSLKLLCLNPFRSGQCLSTASISTNWKGD